MSSTWDKYQCMCGRKFLVEQIHNDELEEPACPECGETNNTLISLGASMSMVHELKDQIVSRFSDINLYDDDNFSSPTCIDDLPEADKAEVLEWLSNILKACASETADAASFELLAALEEAKQDLECLQAHTAPESLGYGAKWKQKALIAREERNALRKEQAEVQQQAERRGKALGEANAELSRLHGEIQEAQQTIKELQEGNRSACESRDMAYRSRDEAIITSNQHYKQTFCLNEKLTEAQQALLVQEDTIKFLDQRLAEAQQTIERKQLYIEKLELSRESAQQTANNISKEKGLELFEARQTIAQQQEALYSAYQSLSYIRDRTDGVIKSTAENARIKVCAAREISEGNKKEETQA